MVSVYLIENIQNSRKYVGVTKAPLKRRLSEHISKSRGNSECPLHRAMRKYGVESFSISIIEETNDYESALECEKKWINHLSTYINGYNATVGGEGALGIVPSEDKKRKLSEAAKKWWSTATPIQRENHRIKSTETFKNNRVSCIGRKASLETKMKMSATRKGKKRGPMSESTKLKLSIAKKGKLLGENNPMKRPDVIEKQRAGCARRTKTQCQHS